MNIETSASYFEIYSYCPDEDDITIRIIVESASVITNEVEEDGNT